MPATRGLTAPRASSTAPPIGNAGPGCADTVESLEQAHSHERTPMHETCFIAQRSGCKGGKDPRSQEPLEALQCSQSVLRRVRGRNGQRTWY